MRSFGMPFSIARGHAAHRLDLFDVAPRAPGQLVGEPLDVVAAAPRVDDTAGARLLLQEQLRVAGDAGAELARQRQRLVERVGVQRLRVSLRRRHRLDARANHVVVDVLRGERPSRRLAVRAQRQRLVALRIELLDQLGPHQARRPQLGHLHEEVHADGPEEAEARREPVDRHARREPGADVLDAVGKRVGHLEVGSRARFLHVIAGDRDRVELRHVLRRVGEDVADDAHARRRRIDVGVAHHELFEDVVLDRAAELLGADALLFGRHDVRAPCTGSTAPFIVIDTVISSSGMPSKS